MKKMFALVSVILILGLFGCKSEETQIKELEATRLQEAEKVAQGFSIAWQQGNYDKVYDYFDSSLTSLRSEADFISFIQASQEVDPFILIYDKVVLQTQDMAYAYYSYSGESVFQPKTPAIEMRWFGDVWRINGFEDYFAKNCIIDSCKENIENVLKTANLGDLETDPESIPLPEMPYLVDSDIDKISDAISNLRKEYFSASVQCSIGSIRGTVLNTNSCVKNAKNDAITDIVSNMNFKCDQAIGFKCSVN